MKLRIRMKIFRSGDFLNLPARAPYGHSVEIGDILEVDDRIALELIREGAAELKLDGPVGRPYQLTMPVQEFQALERKILGRPEKPGPEPARPKTREERNALLAKMHW